MSWRQGLIVVALAVLHFFVCQKSSNSLHLGALVLRKPKRKYLDAKLSNCHSCTMKNVLTSEIFSSETS